MKLFKFDVENPFKTYNKVKKYFKFPKTKIKFGTVKNKNKAKILNIKSRDLEYKCKYRELVHVADPYIKIYLFNKFWIYIYFTAEFTNDLGDKETCSTLYWEQILMYLYEFQNISTTFKCGYSQKYFSKLYNNKLIEIIPSLVCLNKQGLKQLKYESSRNITNNKRSI
jgi:hypothetical protein